MTISELIKRLRTYEKEYGNSDVMVLRYDYCAEVEEDIQRTEWIQILDGAGTFYIKID